MELLGTSNIDGTLYGHVWETNIDMWFRLLLIHSATFQQGTGTVRGKTLKNCLLLNICE